MIKLYPEIIFAAIKASRPVGAFRVWFLAKSFDNGGSGFIPAKAFRQYLNILGVSRATYYEWLLRADRLGLVKRLDNDIYQIASWERGAKLAGIDRLLKPTFIETERYINKGWLAYVWGAYVKHFEGKPISRASLEKLTGVPRRTQQAYEKKSGVINTANYVSYGYPENNPEQAMEICDKPGVFFRAGAIMKQGPNSRKVPYAHLGNKGRTKQINQSLRCNDEDSSGRIYKLYCITDKQAKQAIRQARGGKIGERPLHVWKFYKNALGVNLWDAIAI